MKDYLTIANSPLMWITCAPVVLVVILSVIVFCRKTLTIALKAGISKKECSRAFLTGIVTSIGPSLATFIVMLGLMSAIGMPMSWMRLSVIGNANAELLHAGLGANAIGQTLGADSYDISGFAASVWAMSTMSISWIIMIVFVPKATQIQNRFSKQDSKFVTLISVSSMSGIMSYMTVKSLVVGWDMVVAAVVAAICMVLLSKTSSKLSWLKAYHIGISMIIAMTAAEIFNIFFK